MRLLVAISSVWLLGFGEPVCTPSSSSSPKPAPKAQADAEAKSTPEASEAEAQEAEARGRVGECLAACAGGKTLSKTDQETCRLVCETTADEPDLVATLLARFELCESRCGGQSKTDAATCALNCGEVSLSSLKLPAELRSCLSPCLEQFHDCERGCYAKTQADAEACRLQCMQKAEQCTQECIGERK